MRGRSVLLCAVAAWIFVAPARGGDWPQILGPNRNGIAEGEKLARTWPEGGPRVVWEREVGTGYAGPAVVGGKVVLFHRLGDREVVELLDAATGERLWKKDFPARYVPSYTEDDGPRVVPLVHAEKIYLYGARGVLRCLDFKTGNEIWARDTYADYNSKKPFRGEPPEGYFGFGTSPIVVGDKLLLNVGGDAKGAGIVAFSLDTGDTLWQATNERASYSSPVATTVNGIEHVIFCTRLNTVSVDPKNGAERFRFPFGQPGPKVTAANPLVLRDKLFVSASYEVGAAFADLTTPGSKMQWQDDETMSSQYTTCVADGDHLFGIHGRQDVGGAALRCFNPFTHNVHWTTRDVGYATLLRADGLLVILETERDLILAEANAEKYTEVARAKVFDSTARALPALSNGRLFARDERVLKCLEVGSTKPGSTSSPRGE